MNERSWIGVQNESFISWLIEGIANKFQFQTENITYTTPSIGKENAIDRVSCDTVLPCLENSP